MQGGDAAIDAHKQRKSQERLAMVDAMPADIRACVHDFGLNIVLEFQRHGVNRASSIRHLIRTLERGPTETGVRKLFRDSTPAALLDEYLQAKGLPLLGRDIVAALNDKGLAIVPKEPSQEMLRASMGALAEPALRKVRVSKEHKHRIRLRRAIEAAAAKNSPGYNGEG